MHLGRSGEAYFVGEDDVVGECITCLQDVTSQLQMHLSLHWCVLNAATLAS